MPNPLHMLSACELDLERERARKSSRAWIHDREEHSMDQYRSRLKLSENFERHWSIQISGETHMDQSLVHAFSWGNSYGPMVLKVLLKFPPPHWYWSMDGSSQWKDIGYGI